LDTPAAVNEYYAKLDLATSDIEVVLLANNAGKAIMDPIHKYTVENCFGLVNVNINAVLFNAKYFLSKF
jgi:NADP-dependent 3-hydroxy acid dehydrogenase YdfG